MAKILLGFAIGAITILLGIFFYPKNPISTQLSQRLEIDSLRAKDSISGISYENYLAKAALTEEKLSSLNMRFNDLYILGSVIVMLLLAIIASIYVKTDSDVKKHLNDNFANYKEQVIKYVTEAEQMVEKGKTEFELMAKLRRSIETDIKTVKVEEPDQSV